AANGHVPALWPHQPRNGMGGGGLARPGRPEQRHDARSVHAEACIEPERAQRKADIHVEHHPSSTVLSRRAASSDRNSPPSARMIASITSRAAAASPPGVWIAV